MDFIADNFALIRWIVIILVVVLLGWRQFWREYQGKSEAQKHKPSGLFSRKFVSAFDLSRELLFADHKVEERINAVYTQEPSRDNFQSTDNYLFALYSYHLGKGNKLAARDSLRQVLSLPEANSRSALVAWKALRGLGQIPDTATARQPLGVVIELPAGNQAAADMIAAYSDGTAEYISHDGKIISRTTPDEKSRLLTSEVLKASEPIIKVSPVYETHQSSNKKVVRISILTPGGIRTAEARPEAVGEDPAMASAVDAGKRLRNALITRDDKPIGEA